MSPLPLQTQLSVLFCVASAMATLHSRGLQHGRLHPENFLIVNRYEAAIIDYGPFKFATASGPDRRLSFVAPELQSGPLKSPSKRTFVRLQCSCSLSSRENVLAVERPRRFFMGCVQRFRNRFRGNCAA
jgi:serine/threonine protein kinase